MERQAYMKAFIPLCDQDGCRKLASYSVFGKHGTHFGDYCEVHANQKVDAMNRYEAAVKSASR